MHRLSRHHRTFTAFVAALVLLWSQLALAAYACPGAGNTTAPSTMAERMAAGEPCAGLADPIDTPQPALCHPHCAGAPESADTAPQPVLAQPALLAAWPAPLLPVVWVEGTPAPGGGSAEAVPRPPPKPLFLATLRLRV